MLYMYTTLYTYNYYHALLSEAGAEAEQAEHAAEDRADGADGVRLEQPP